MISNPRPPEESHEERDITDYQHQGPPDFDQREISGDVDGGCDGNKNEVIR